MHKTAANAEGLKWEFRFTQNKSNTLVQDIGVAETLRQQHENVNEL